MQEMCGKGNKMRKEGSRKRRVEKKGQRIKRDLGSSNKVIERGGI